jgi:hypothetical protein
MCWGLGIRDWMIGVLHADIEAILADATVPISIACVPGRGFTFGATSLDLASPPRMRVAPGPPHSTAYVELSFGR